MKFINLHSHKHQSNLKNESTLINLDLSLVNEIELASNKWYTIGIHPWFIETNDLDNQIAKLEKLAINKNVLAIGECGLDRSQKTNIPFETQKIVFSQQIKLAEKLNKPILMHCVKSYSDLLEYLKAGIKTSLIIHDFTANNAICSKLLEYKIYFSFGHRLLNSEKTKDCFAKLPIERCFLETDDSEQIIEEIYKSAALIKNLTINELKKQMHKNFLELFKISID